MLQKRSLPIAFSLLLLMLSFLGAQFVHTYTHELHHEHHCCYAHQEQHDVMITLDQNCEICDFIFTSVYISQTFEFQFITSFLQQTYAVAIQRDPYTLILYTPSRAPPYFV